MKKSTLFAIGIIVLGIAIIVISIIGLNNDKTAHISLILVGLAFFGGGKVLLLESLKKRNKKN